MGGEDLRKVQSQILEQAVPTPGVALAVRCEEDLDMLLAHSEDRWTVVEFSTKWSAACAAMWRPFEDAAQDYPEACFLRVDVGQLSGAISQHSVTRIPSYTFYWSGDKEREFAGASERKLREVLMDCLELGSAREEVAREEARREAERALEEERRRAAAELEAQFLATQRAERAAKLAADHSARLVAEEVAEFERALVAEAEEDKRKSRACKQQYVDDVGRRARIQEIERRGNVAYDVLKCRANVLVPIRYTRKIPVGIEFQDKRATIKVMRDLAKMCQTLNVPGVIVCCQDAREASEERHEPAQVALSKAECVKNTLVNLGVLGSKLEAKSAVQECEFAHYILFKVPRHQAPR